MGFVVMVMVSCHQSSSDLVVVLWSAVEPNSSFTGKHIVSVHCLCTPYFRMDFFKIQFWYSKHKKFNNLLLVCVWKRQRQKKEEKEKESAFTLRSFRKRYKKRTESIDIDSFHSVAEYTPGSSQTTPPHISLHTSTFWHLTHTHTHLSPPHCSLTSSLSLPSTHTTHYRSTKKVREKMAHKHISIQTEFLFTVTREKEYNTQHICFSCVLKRAWSSVQEENILIWLNPNCTKNHSELSCDYIQYGVNISHRYTGFRNCNAVRIHSGLNALVQRRCKAVGLVGSFTPIPLWTPADKRVTET